MNKQGGYYRRTISKWQRSRFALLTLLAALIPRGILFRAYDAWVSIASGNQSPTHVGNLYGLYGRREGVPAHVFGAGSMVEFKGRVFRAPAKPKEYLHAVYGNYMLLPPETERRSGHRISAVSLVSAPTNLNNHACTRT